MSSFCLKQTNAGPRPEMSASLGSFILFLRYFYLFCSLIKGAGTFPLGMFPNFCCNISQIYYNRPCCYRRLLKTKITFWADQQIASATTRPMSKRKPAEPKQEDEKRNQQQSGFQLFRDLRCVALTNMNRVQILGSLSSTVLQIWSSPAGGWRGSEVFLYLLLAFQVGQNKYLWILALSIKLRDMVECAMFKPYLSKCVEIIDRHSEGKDLFLSLVCIKQAVGFVGWFPFWGSPLLPF